MLRERLGAIAGVTVQDQGQKQCGIVTFTVEGVASGVVKERLAVHDINVWTSPCRSTRLDMEARGLEDVVRASVHYYNTEEEIERLCRAVAQTHQYFLNQLQEFKRSPQRFRSWLQVPFHQE